MVLPPDLITSHYFWLLADKWLQFTFMWVKNPELLWLIVPVWLNWLLTEYFQERKGTGYGNAITNGFVMFWVGIDSLRTIVNEYARKSLAVSLVHVGMVAILLGYGSMIMINAIRGKKIAHIIGRIREVTYFSTIAIGIIYNAVPVDFDTVLSLLVFFPIFYFGVEIALRFMPPPKEEFIEEKEQKKVEKPSPQQPTQQQVQYQKRKSLLRKILFGRRR